MAPDIANDRAAKAIAAIARNGLVLRHSCYKRKEAASIKMQSLVRWRMLSKMRHTVLQYQFCSAGTKTAPRHDR